MNSALQKQGFTLIELMTVVTIISILAAIAVPNFLNAIIRAKVARSMAEQELLVWALEMYDVDRDGYPDNAYTGQPSLGDLVPLTTPVSYLPQIPYDAFIAPTKFERREFVQTKRAGNPYYSYINFLQTNDGQRLSLTPYALEGSANYIVWGMGPAFTLDADPMKPDSFSVYSPSNGTQSAGIITTFGP